VDFYTGIFKGKNLGNLWKYEFMIIRSLAKAIYGPSVYFDVVLLCFVLGRKCNVADPIASKWDPYIFVYLSKMSP
jgi:hypothetical protein